MQCNRRLNTSFGGSLFDGRTRSRLNIPFQGVRLAIRLGCRLNTSFDDATVGWVCGCKFNTSFNISMPSTPKEYRALSAKQASVRKLSSVGGVGQWRWRGWWPEGGGHISSPLSPTVYVGWSSNWCPCDWVGVGVCGGVPSGVPHALFLHSWARDKYIAPLNLQKASSSEVNR